MWAPIELVGSRRAEGEVKYSLDRYGTSGSDAEFSLATTFFARSSCFFSPFLLGSQKESHYYFGRFIYYVMTGQGYGVFEWIIKLIFSCTHCHFEGRAELLERHFYSMNYEFKSTAHKLLLYILVLLYVLFWFLVDFTFPLHYSSYCMYCCKKVDRTADLFYCTALPIIRFCCKKVDHIINFFFNFTALPIICTVLKNRPVTSKSIGITIGT